MYPQLVNSKVDPRVIESVWEIVERMPPAFRFGCNSQTTNVSLPSKDEAASIFPPEAFKLDMLSEDDFLGRVSWYFPELEAYHPYDKPTILMQVTETGIKIDSKLKFYGRKNFVLADLLLPEQTLPSNGNNPTEFENVIVPDEATLVNEALAHLKDRK